MEDVYLNYVCYAILLFSFTFSLASLPTDYGLNASPSSSGHRFVEADGVWQLVVVIFLVYTMLPMKTHVAFFMGASLPVAHLAVSAALVHNQTVGLRWQQVSEQVQSGKPCSWLRDPASSFKGRNINSALFESDETAKTDEGEAVP